MAFFDFLNDINDFYSDPWMTYSPIDDYRRLRRSTMRLLDEHDPARHSSSTKKEKEDAEPAPSGETAVEKADKEPKTLGLRSLIRVPACDSHETDTEFVIEAEIPGMKKEDIELHYNEKTNVLSVTAERKDEKTTEKTRKDGSKYHLSERSYGSFKRSFRLPQECASEVDKIEATSSDGVLTIHCPKGKVEEKPALKRITIN
ncbi:putative HSP20 family protein [Blattamonas nauphoetae]|uniref:HSP20 family protein n=1 Tax=Blattamonas nauphoetae TaxID=2049346 RepID=A0ABQ9Y4H5_9EUKA|nr:putative HSP20 family protein [Blattamonas nauphoetae]KAK2958614.1 putative HSP20 family protein [Blattamonas nauphoetae]